MSSSTKSGAPRKNPAPGETSRARRRVLKALALAPVVPSVLSGSVWALTQAQTRPSPQAKVPPPQPAATEVKPSPEAETLAEIIKQRYGKFLNEDQMEEIKLGLERGIRGRRALHSFKLTNADEPDTIFKAK